MNFSLAEEDYLKQIYHLQQPGTPVSTSRLAREMRTQPASVTDMLKKLHGKKLVDYRKYHGFRLNAAGLAAALNVVRRHRLWEAFLVNKLGFHWGEVHPIAEELEHVASPDLILRLESFLKFPRTDPHGDPIPDRHGKLPALRQRPLAGMEAQRSYVVSAVTNQSPDLLQLLLERHIGIGTKLRLDTRNEFDGSGEVTVYKQGVCLLSDKVASNILVHYDQATALR